MLKNSVIEITASLEVNSEHPIAAGIVNTAKKMGIQFLKVDDFKAIPGKEVEGVVNGKKYKVVSPNYLKEDVEVNDEVEKVKQQGRHCKRKILRKQ